MHIPICVISCKECESTKSNDPLYDLVAQIKSDLPMIGMKKEPTAFHDSGEPEPCKYRGVFPIPSDQRIAHGLSPIKLYYSCDLGYGIPNGIVCKCSGCGPGCVGYVED